VNDSRRGCNESEGDDHVVEQAAFGVPMDFGRSRSGLINRSQLRGNHVKLWVMLPAQAIVGQFLVTFKEFPQRQESAGLNNIDKVLQQMQTQGD
jgi:hypothetical protein